MRGCRPRGGLGRHPPRDRWIARTVVPTVVVELLRGRYRVGRRTPRHACAEVAKTLRGEFAAIDLATCPAHLHINLDARWRGHGAGSALTEAYLDELRALDVPGVHLLTTILNLSAVDLYTRLRFGLLGARATRLWARVTEGYVENRCYGLRLG